MKIVSYVNKNNISVLFDDGFIISNIVYSNFKNGAVSNPHRPSYCGVGFMGYGNFDSNDLSYNIWRGMIERCYGKNKTRVKDLSYSACYVSEEWHNFQNFAKWYNENYYKLENEKMTLDKDILVKDNMLYSKELCVIVPNSINMLINGRNRIDKGDYPLGVSYHKKTSKYQANCNNNKKNIYLGLYNTPEEAHLVYKNYKEKIINEMADKYKEEIPDKLYQALINFKV